MVEFHKTEFMAVERRSVCKGISQNGRTETTPTRSVSDLATVSPTMTSPEIRRYNYEPREGSSLDDDLLYSRKTNLEEYDEDRDCIPEYFYHGLQNFYRLLQKSARLLLITMALLAGVLAHQNSVPVTNPQPPLKLIQGCPSELVHSRSFRQVQMMCRTQPAQAVAAYEGIQDAMLQCEEKMRFQPWDCSNIGNILLDPPLLKYAYKESALIWALSSAGATWGIATACSQGWLAECACTPSPGQTQWEWGGCSYGVNHGLASSRKMLSRTTIAGNSPLRAAEKHNLKAGRLAVKKTLTSSCKCHGVSGSCQQKTCWKKTADLETITKHLIDKYNRARVVADPTKSRNSDLLVLETSPDHCTSRPRIPRVCGWRNETHSQGDCGRLCCGRGFNITHEVVQYKCDCKFVWCCNLVCNDCIMHKWVSTCS